MSFDATRAAWAARDAGAIEGGPRLLVALAMADRAHNGTGELTAGTRGLAALCGVSNPTVTATLRGLMSAGIVERTERGIGTRPSRWRWVLAPPPTGLAQAVDNGTQRATSTTQANTLRAKSNRQRAKSDALACKSTTQNQDQGVNQGESAGCEHEHELPPALRGGVDPSEVPERVAALREALGGRHALAQASQPPPSVTADNGRRGGKAATSHTGAGPTLAPVLSMAELTEFMAAEE